MKVANTTKDINTISAQPPTFEAPWYYVDKKNCFVYVAFSYDAGYVGRCRVGDRG